MELLKAILCFLFVVFVVSMLTANNSSEAYIDQYKAIAISEMHRSGVPASIKLAQGLLESNRGKSELAKNANNHFGIKCGKYWEGTGYYIEDDDYDKNGQLIKSCFRSYDDPYESYIAHTEFLTNPKSAYRYGHLFDLNITNYKGWAKGLKESGYATDPKYPSKLIQIIEQYELYLYDQESEILVNQAPEKEIDHQEIQSDMAIAWIDNSSPAAEKEQIDLPRNNVVHAEKRSRSSSSQRTSSKSMHTVRLGESAAEIAKLYGIKEDDLYLYNRIPLNSYLKPGSKIKVDGYLHWGERAQYSLAETDTSQELLFADEVVESF